MAGLCGTNRVRRRRPHTPNLEKWRNAWSARPQGGHGGPPRGAGERGVPSYMRNTGLKAWTGRASFRAIDDETGLTALTSSDTQDFTIKSGGTETRKFEATLPKAKFWHFDHPSLYQLIFSIASADETHRLTATFGVRKFEARGSGFYLNGERVRLMGVERMAGSNPECGMAEPSEWITH